MLTPYQIADRARSIRAINRLFRKQDDSHLWPILGRFNVTERAIRRIRRMQLGLEGLEYTLTLEATISEIVNDPRIG